MLGYPHEFNLIRMSKKMNKTQTKKIALILLLSLCMILPTVSAKRKTFVRVYTVPDFDDFVQYDNSVALKNGHIKVDICYKFFWYAEDWTYLGYAYQYVSGIDKGDQAMLHGYGVFYSELLDKPGTITYKIGNNYDADGFWAGRLSLVEGTGYFEGLKGQGDLNFDLFAFDFYLDYDPWA